jgi:(1->4)-alpha-D-glucan 1-alpha-D-glucosylmutase
VSEASRPFISDVRRFHELISRAGMRNSLGQTLLKIACPGVPDFYQGSELWDLHLVDPDNRNPIDFEIRRHALRDLTSRGSSVQIAKELTDNWSDGRIKLYVIWRSLNCRRSHPELFRQGEFSPLEVVGPRAEHLIAFSRKLGQVEAVAVIPVYMLSAGHDATDNASGEFWEGTSLVLASGSRGTWRNVFTTEPVKTASDGGTLSIAVKDLIEHFPIALLISEDGV